MTLERIAELRHGTRAERRCLTFEELEEVFTLAEAHLQSLAERKDGPKSKLEMGSLPPIHIPAVC